MTIYMLDAQLSDMDSFNEAGEFALRRAVVVAINEEAAINAVILAISGKEMFSGIRDKGKFSRSDRPGFKPESCVVQAIGEAKDARTRILSWEIVPPEGWGEDA